MRTKLTDAETAQAHNLADGIDVQIVFDSDLAKTISEHAFSAAVTSKLLLTAAHAHHGSPSAFMEMALQAITMIDSMRTDENSTTSVQ